MSEAGETGRIIERAAGGAGLSRAEAAALLALEDEGARRELYAAADALKRRLWGDRVTYVVNLNLNWTNVCAQHCGFCNFRRDERDPDSYRLSLDECLAHVARRLPFGITEVTIQGGLDFGTPVGFYFDLVRELKRAFPALHVHAYSPEEVAFLRERTGWPYASIVERLRDAGLGSMPGTAAEILVDDVRRRLCAEKVMSGEWLEIVETAHRAGLPTTATMMYGHVETLEHRAEHLGRLLEAQRRTGGFTEFIQLPFVSARAPIALKRGLRSPETREALNLVAVSRLFFGEELPHVQAVPWVKRGLDEAAASLGCGADDLGGTLIEEKITRAAGADFGSYVPAAELRARVEAEGLRPLQRTTLYGEAGGREAEAAGRAAPPGLVPIRGRVARGGA
ncbi:MAG TPA: 5-amino-6-(D-ribitylamino)uracil--L-tyrosine 4-hydroxyphenyl transferase CofH [Pyrinomonadaceae bacterium]|nr:5-amino-6-(D-ribitylamino)uracil--L-tyrosine 4-hydroxyphenyl transferase CofH [Pyrinomonadaceae bacterium]